MTDLRDSLGRLFDAVRFRKKPDGKPFTNIRGHFMPRGGRKPKNKPMISSPEPTPAAAPEITPAPAPVETPPAAKVDFGDVSAALKSLPGGATESTSERPNADSLTDDIRAVGDNPTAETVIGLLQTGLIIMGDVDEGTLSAAEKDILRRPLIRVMSKYGVGKEMLPAEIELVVATLSLLAIRLQKPKTAASFAKIRYWFVQKFFAGRGRKMAHVLKEEVGDTVRAV